MTKRPLDPETLREVFLYLFHCWLAKHLHLAPLRLGLSENDGILIASEFTLYYSTASLTAAAAQEVQGHSDVPTYFFAPSLPPGIMGTDTFDLQPAMHEPLSRIISVIEKHWKWLEEHRERALYRKEAFEVLDAGRFNVWRAKSTTRLLFSPQEAEPYGFVATQNGPRDFFLRKSKSCRTEGINVATGNYKRAQHRQEDKSYINIDLLADPGEVCLLHLVSAGAGYKAFPRQAPDPELALF